MPSDRSQRPVDMTHAHAELMDVIPRASMARSTMWFVGYDETGDRDSVLMVALADLPQHGLAVPRLW